MTIIDIAKTIWDKDKTAAFVLKRTNGYQTRLCMNAEWATTAVDKDGKLGHILQKLPLVITDQFITVENLTADDWSITNIPA